LDHNPKRLAISDVIGRRAQGVALARSARNHESNADTLAISRQPASMRPRTHPLLLPSGVQSPAKAQVSS
jgi:hypothetical protein